MGYGSDTCHHELVDLELAVAVELDGPFLHAHEDDVPPVTCEGDDRPLGARRNWNGCFLFEYENETTTDGASFGLATGDAGVNKKE